MKYESRQLDLAGLWQSQHRPEASVPATNLGWRPTFAREPGETVADQKHGVALLHSLFEQQVELRPGQVALCDGCVSLTYAEVECRANQLARRLRTLGVRPGVLVGIYLERSAEAIVAILSILKAGGAYLPVDPEYPCEWLATIVEDSQLRLIITRTDLASQIPTGVVQAVCTDALWEGLAEPATRLESGAQPDDPAYVIYTSGSTGTPKGVVVEHRNIVYSTQCRREYYAIPVERFALVPSLAFDASVATIFWTLSQGGTLCLPPTRLERDPARLSQWITDERITHWLSVPALYRLLLDQPIGRLRSLQVVVLGGESCSSTIIHAHHAAIPHSELYIEYGPTEATVWSSVQCCRPGRAVDGTTIGSPLAGTRMLVLDESRQPVAFGEPGELYIGGPGVARGYLRKAQLTSERFLVDRFSRRAGDRLYRTGDRVHQLPDGSFAFLGRMDSQAKVRGHRVELGQVEAALGLLHGVAQAVVITQRLASHNQLVAFVVPRRGARLTAAGLSQALRERLPNYMVPSHFTLLEELPLTARGKIDRQALQTAEVPLTSPTREFVLPKDETERRLVACWEGVFGQAPIGACDDFFELGGDSLLAAGLFARIEAQFGQTLPPETLLERPTVRQLAKLLQGPSTSCAASSAVRIQAGLRQPPLFCLPGIGGHVLEFRELAAQLRSRHAVYGLRPAGLEDQLAPHGNIEEMAAHAIQQMRQVQSHGPYALVGYSLGGVVAFEMARQLRQAGQEISLLALLDSRLWSPSAPLSLWQRLRLHGNNLYHSTVRGRWHYLCERGRLFAAKLRRLSFRPSEDDVVLGLALSAASRRVVRLHWQAWRDYQPGDYDGDLLLFVAQRHPAMPDEDGRDPTLGWSRRTRGGVDVTLMNATHAEMLRPESSKVLAIAIEARLARAAGHNLQLTGS